MPIFLREGYRPVCLFILSCLYVCCKLGYHCGEGAVGLSSLSTGRGTLGWLQYPFNSGSLSIALTLLLYSPVHLALLCLPALLTENLDSLLSLLLQALLSKAALSFSLDASGSKPRSVSSSSPPVGRPVCVSLCWYAEKSQHVCGWVKEAVLQSQPGERQGYIFFALFVGCFIRLFWAAYTSLLKVSHLLPV